VSDASEIIIDGFTETAELTTNEFENNYLKMMQSQSMWRTEFEEKKKEIAANKRDLLALSKEKDEGIRDDLQKRIDDFDPCCPMTPPRCWNIGRPEAEGEAAANPRLPAFNMIMQVDIMGTFTFDVSLVAFQHSLGDLPVKAVFELTRMLYKSTTGMSSNTNTSTLT
jgi:hypothetical protein